MRDPADALEVADRITVLRRGRIVQCGTPSEILGVPASRFVARLFQWEDDQCRRQVRR